MENRVWVIEGADSDSSSAALGLLVGAMDWEAVLRSVLRAPVPIFYQPCP